MSMILSWVLFPLVLAALGLGWGALVEWAAGERSARRAHDPARARRGDRRRGAPHRVLHQRARRGAGRRRRRRSLGLARAWRRVRIPPPALARRRSARSSIYGAPGDPQRAGDLPRLRAARRHGDVARVHRPVLRARPLARVAADARPSSCCSTRTSRLRLSRRARSCSSASATGSRASTSPGSSSPTWPSARRRSRCAASELLEPLVAEPLAARRSSRSSPRSRRCCSATPRGAGSRS